jgi:hypothetical protein
MNDTPSKTIQKSRKKTQVHREHTDQDTIETVHFETKVCINIYNIYNCHVEIWWGQTGQKEQDGKRFPMLLNYTYQKKKREKVDNEKENSK